MTVTIDLDLSELSAAERLVLWRYRQHSSNGRLFGRSGAMFTQSEAAAHLGITAGTYARWEEGASSATDTTIVSLGPITPTLGELCFIARRRSGLKLQEVQNSFGVPHHDVVAGSTRELISRPWFHKLERAGDPRVVSHWEGLGFRFP